ncbi:hypothetical protein [Lactococcus lactis]|uniref:hypothetical protein n=1 Tax=Lactococcus lactis TaxID=1358 RepID=UPI00194EC998|nr:hypothetical protein [Lactococcus lactis]
MFYLSDGTGAYVWDCDHWTFLDFTGVTQSDWAAKEKEAGYIKNKPFKVLGNGLFVDEDGLLNVTVKGNVKSDWNATGGSDAEIVNKPFKTLGKNLEVDEDERLNVNAIVNIKDSNGEILPQKDGVVTLPDMPKSTVISVNGQTGNVVIPIGESLSKSIALNDLGVEKGQQYSIYNLEVQPSGNEPDDLPTGNVYQRLLEVYYGTSPYYNYIQRYSVTTLNGVTIYTRARLDDSTWTDWVPLNSSGNSTVKEADKLSTARDLKVDLTSKLAQSFDGSKDATTIGVTGTLPLANGGTGNNKGEAIPKTTNPNKDITDGILNSGATNPVLKYRILNDVIYISGSIDVVADGQTSGMQVKVGNIPTEYMPKKAVQGVGYIPIKCDYLGEGREKGSVIVVGDSQSSTSAQGAVMFYASTEGTEKLTSATWTFHGSYNLI